MLKLDGVSKTFRTGADRVVALRDVDLELPRGEFVTVIGSNGAGKSTLLGLIAGAFLPTEGRVWLDGEDVTGVSAFRRARRIGRILQNPLAGTAPSMTVAENLALASRRARRGLRQALPRRTRRAFREQLASLGIGLEERMECRVALLSGGERQALTVLMATLARPDVLLLDEHTAALDPRNAQAIAELTCRFIDDLALTALMVTHNMEQAIALGERLIMLHKGQVVTELRGREKAGSQPSDLVRLFSERRICDDELLLGTCGTAD
ncbi:MAG: ATP-binding cassette domain-containing protein [Candidatus Bipolaricaulota bacterium]